MYLSRAFVVSTERMEVPVSPSGDRGEEGVCDVHVASKRDVEQINRLGNLEF